MSWPAHAQPEAVEPWATVISTVLAIDPGDTESGWCVVDTASCAPISFGKNANEDVRGMLYAAMHDVDLLAVEMVASYGMPVGAEVFETCVWIGRYVEAFRHKPTRLEKRLPVKLHHCHDSKAKDSNVRRALVDRFAPGQPNHGKGTKKVPGWFHGFHSDVWQAYALAVYVADTLAPDKETA